MTQSRWITGLSIALFISLALNIFVAGWVAGHGKGPRGGHGGLSEAGMRVGIQRVLRVLPPDDRRVVETMFEAERPSIRQQFEALRQAHQAVAATLRAQPFDQAAFEQAYGVMRQHSGAVQDAIHSVIVAAVPKLTNAGRAELALGRWRHDDER
ncbi:MAG: periplasmic heavy metal sensor [Dongiaceae bacterium]